MDNEIGDPFDGRSPGASNLQEYEDLLGVQEVPVDDVDLQMTGFQEEYAPTPYTAPIANMVVQRDQNGAVRDEWEETRKAMMELSNLDANILERNADPPKNLETTEILPQQSEEMKKAFTIKQEPLDVPPFTSGIATNTIEDAIEISDTEDPDSIHMHNTKMSDGVVILSDEEDQLTTAPFPKQRMAFLRVPRPTTKCTSAEIEKLHRIQCGYAESALGKKISPGAWKPLASPNTIRLETSVPIKQEDGEVEFIWTKMDDRVIEIDSDCEPSPTPRLDLGKSFLKGLDPKNKRSELAVDDDESAWMRVEQIPDEDNGKTFRALKKTYSAKVKSGSISMEDKIEFVRAERVEKLRLARLKAQYEIDRGYSDDDNSDNGLFLSPSPRNASRKRRAANDSDAEDEDPDTRSSKQPKQKISSERSQQEELETNMLAGLEEFCKKDVEEGKRSGKKVRGKNKIRAEGGMKVGPKKPRRKLNKAGCSNDVSSLLTSNVYEDADANLNREALPITGITHKDKALAALAASVPLGTTKEDAASQKNRIREATRILGRNIKGSCKADGVNGWTLPALRSSLRHHQVLGAGFMVDRETGGEEPLGGILADAMGLGKTLMILALCIANPPPRDEKCRTTLIVCTPALLVQWVREIDKHIQTNHFLVHTHHGSGKTRINTMQSQDIILTTYQEVVRSYPKFQAPEDVRGEVQLKDWWEKHWNQEKEVLHQVMFNRIVLDESQVIKNHKTQTSIACRALMAKHRWAVSATPIMNRVEELYPYFKFLRVPYTGSYREFQENYCKKGSDDCNSRLHCLLDQIMVRRTLKDTILGEPIVKLPKHNQRTIDIDFSPVERAIYRRVYKRFVTSLNEASADGTLEKHPGLGLIAFLRLRQMCAHTFLVQEVLIKYLDLENIDSIERELIPSATPETKNDRILLSALRRMIEARPRLSEEPQESEHEQVQPGKLAAKLGSYLKTLKAKSNWVELYRRIKCQSCGEPPERAIVTSCLHIYCQECLEGLALEASARDQNETTCLACGVTFRGAESCDGLKELEWDDSWLLKDDTSRKKRSNQVNMEWVFYQDTLVMSAKVTAVKKQVENWLKEGPHEKIIIFSQFHMIMQVLEKVCQKKKWKYCTYNGKMSHKARDETIKTFAEDSDMKIMIASLQCGGVGLNLTMASKVICIDLWYNSCVEQQAFCRVFRIGQNSETFITRFVVSNSADHKLMDMQLRKNALIVRAMEDKSIMSKLTVSDILRLFGEVRLDKNKRPFVHLEDDEKMDSLFEKKGQT